jgi:hypothetical protein
MYADWIKLLLKYSTISYCRSLSVISMMWQHSVPCLSCVLGPQEEKDYKSMAHPSSLTIKVKGEKCLSLEHYGVLQVVATSTVLLQGEVLD